MKHALGLTTAIVLAANAAMAQSMEITEHADRPGMIGPEDWFTGKAYVSPVFGPKMNDVNAGEVTFLPGTRSAWHTHPAGQMLVVTHGTGWVQVRGEERRTIKAGDVIWTPAGVEHWHGATATTSMTHYAIQANVDGSAAIWGEHVTDAEYDE